LPPDEYNDLLLKYIHLWDKEEYRWSKYYSENDSAPITDEAIDALTSYALASYRYISNNMSLTQIKKYKDKMFVGHLARKRDLSLDEITKMKGKELDDLSDVRIFTEYEIASNPHFFDPESLKNKAKQYMTKPTFSKLNKAWGKRQRYNENLVKFRRIMDDAFRVNMSMEDIKYLISATGASNAEFFAYVENHDETNISSKLGVKFKILQKFIEINEV